MQYYINTLLLPSPPTVNWICESQLYQVIIIIILFIYFNKWLEKITWFSDLCKRKIQTNISIRGKLYCYCFYYYYLLLLLLLLSEKLKVKENQRNYFYYYMISAYSTSFQQSRHNGYVLAQQRLDGASTCRFNYNWEEYKQGFGGPTGYYWMGNERMYQLTKKGGCSVRFDLMGTTGESYQVFYSSFSISSEASKYTLYVGGLIGLLVLFVSPTRPYVSKFLVYF